ncbi:MAG: hypothetical protein Q8Q42_01820 [Nanoarchaeota archaeon]|nr:hypothetical protein [Nanoarchaeota archaeon]
MRRRLNYGSPELEKRFHEEVDLRVDSWTRAVQEVLERIGSRDHYTVRDLTKQIVYPDLPSIEVAVGYGDGFSVPIQLYTRVQRRLGRIVERECFGNEDLVFHASGRDVDHASVFRRDLLLELRTEGEKLMDLNDGRVGNRELTLAIGFEASNKGVGIVRGLTEEYSPEWGWVQDKTGERITYSKK